MLLNDKHDHTKNSKIYQLKKHHRPLPPPLPLPICLLLKFLNKNLSTFLNLVINSFRSFNNLSLSPVMTWNISQKHKLHFWFPALHGVLLLITNNLISTFSPFFYISQIKEDSFDLFLYCLYLKEVKEV